MTQQTEAQRLAALLYSHEWSEAHDAAAELRRLHSVNAQLLEALEEITSDYADRFDLDDPSTNPGIKSSIKQARAAIAQAKDSNAA